MPREEKKKSRLPLIITIFIAFIMATSVIGYFGFGSGSDVQVYDYKGFKVRDLGTHVEVKIGTDYIPFTTHPEEAESLNADPAAMNNIKTSKQIYLTFDPEQTAESLQQIDYNRLQLVEQLGRFNIYAVQGITSAKSSLNLPTITCGNATQFIPVIEFREGNETKITKEGTNCIILEALNPADFTKLRERIIYGLYGVVG